MVLFPKTGYLHTISYYFPLNFHMVLFSQITIPIVSQSDLEKAIEILDRSAHISSLRIYLTIPNGVINKNNNSTHSRRMMVEALIPAPPNPKMGSLFGRSLGVSSLHILNLFLTLFNLLTVSLCLKCRMHY